MKRSKTATILGNAYESLSRFLRFSQSNNSAARLVQTFIMTRIISALLLIAGSLLASPTFELVDTNPGSPEFKQRFFGSFGVNGDIEPTLTQEDRPLYESIEPHLKNNPRKAIELARKGVNKDSNAAFDFLLGSLYYTQNDYQNAATYLKAALKKFPDFRRAHRNLALIYIQRDRYDDAIKHLIRVIELGGGDGQSYSMLGYAYLTNEKYQSALSAYQLARMFLSDSLDVRRGEAQCLLMTGQHNAAIALFEELLDEAPNTQDFWLFQANSFLALDQLDNAIANLELAHSVSTPKASSLTLLGDLYLTNDAYSLALTSYEEALRRDPQINPGQAIRPLRRLIQLGLFDLAESYLGLLRSTLASQMSPSENAEVSVFEAQLLVEAGQQEEGLKQLEALIKTDPLNSHALLYIAEVKLNNEAYEEAEFYYERAKSVPEAQVEALIGLGRTCVAEAKFKDALEHLRQCQRIESRRNVAQFIASIEKVVAAQ